MTRIQLLDRLPGTFGETKLRGTRAFTSIILAVALVLTIFLYPLSPILSSTGNAGALVSSQSEISHWPGWAGIKHMVVFGDSITSAKFNVHGEQPSKINPLGNPDFPGNTSAIGPNWVSFLTATYNATFLKTLNLAMGGATVDDDIVKQMLPVVKSFKDQIARYWLPNYVPPSLQFNWKAHDTLFATFLGSNDVSRAYLKSWTSALNDDIDEYVALLDVLYQGGGRNFLVLKVLPFERSPMLDRTDAEAIREMGDLIRAYNNNLTRAVSQFSSTYSDATVFLFDTHALFNQLLDDPCSYEETCPLQVTTTYCKAYMGEKDDQYKFDPECQYSADKYFWLNTLHPSFRVHNATAKAIAAYLSNSTVKA